MAEGDAVVGWRAREEAVDNGGGRRGEESAVTWSKWRWAGGGGGGGARAPAEIRRDLKPRAPCVPPDPPIARCHVWSRARVRRGWDPGGRGRESRAGPHVGGFAGWWWGGEWWGPRLGGKDRHGGGLKRRLIGTWRAVWELGHSAVSLACFQVLLVAKREVIN